MTGTDPAPVVASHTRTATSDSPDYCEECSKAAQEWVTWPCRFATAPGVAARRDALTVRLVRQEHEWGCGVAALAMVTGETYDEVRTWILDNWVHNVMAVDPSEWLTKQGATQYAVDWYLGEHGYAWRRLYRAWTDAGAWPPQPFAPVHIAQVVQPSGMAHFVVLTSDGRVLDPMSETPRSLTDWEQINFVQGIWLADLDGDAYLVRRLRELAEGSDTVAVDAVCDAMDAEHHRVYHVHAAECCWAGYSRYGLATIRALADHLEQRGDPS